MEELYFVELINRTAPDDELGDVYEVSVSCGEGEFVKDDEIGDYCEDFERNYYISEQMFLSESMEQFVYGKEIDSDEFDEMGGYSEYDFSKSIMVGDTDSDIEFGKNLEMKTVLIESSEKCTLTPDAKVRSLMELNNRLQ